MLKKLIKETILTSVLICLFLGFSFGDRGFEDDNPFPYPSKYTDGLSCSGNTALGDCVSVKQRNDTIIVRLLNVFGLDDSIEQERDLKFIDYAKAILNMALALISFIALIMTIYTFYMMFFSENEAGIKKAKGNLSGIFIALGVIGLSWLIVSLIFRRYQSNLKEKEEEIGGRNVTLMNTNTQNYQIYLTIV